MFGCQRLVVGLGVQKMVRVGKMPMKIKAEINYSAIRPDSFGQEHNIRFYLVPLVLNLVKVMQGTFEPSKM